jgi:hypothetical protein
LKVVGGDYLSKTLTAFIAKLAARRIYLFALWTSKFQLISALVAELRIYWIVKLAFWTFHKLPSRQNRSA